MATENESREIQSETLMLFAEQINDMAQVGGSPALTEALRAVANFAHQKASEIRAGRWIYAAPTDQPPARR